MLEKIQFNKISNISLTKIAFTLQFLFFCIIIYKIFVIKNSIDNFLPLNTISLERWLILPGVIGVILVYVAKKDENTFLKKVNFFLKSFSISLIILYLISSIIYTKFLVYSILFALLILIIYVIFIFKNKDKLSEYLNEVITENEDIKEIKSKPGDMPLGEILIRNVDEDGKPFADQDDFIPSGKKGVIPLSERLVHVLVLGPTKEKNIHKGVKVISVLSAEEMYTSVHQYFDEVDVAILSAAVADYTPKEKATQKIKKKEDTFSLELVKNKDILASLGAIKKHQKLIGFALETENETENAKHKIQKKNLDAIVLNSLNDKGAGFGTDTNKITFITSDFYEIKFELKSKTEVAFDILEQIEKML